MEHGRCEEGGAVALGERGATFDFWSGGCAEEFLEHRSPLVFLGGGGCRVVVLLDARLVFAQVEGGGGEGQTGGAI